MDIMSLKSLHFRAVFPRTTPGKKRLPTYKEAIEGCLEVMESKHAFDHKSAVAVMV